MDIVNQFLSFNKLMGQGLVKIVYFLGMILILLGVLFGIVGAFGMMTINFMQGLGMLIFTPLGGIVGICFLRFACELYIAIFRMSDDLTAIRNAGAMPPKV
jgi:hypothetical protein